MTAFGLLLLGLGGTLIATGITDPPGGLPRVIRRAVTGGGLKLRDPNTQPAAATDPTVGIVNALHTSGQPSPTPAPAAARRGSVTT